ncbi:MAG TPA: hypothetical protein VGM54_02060 [Chthoniobacter sp.]|jgi:hypothetical protein
MTPKFAEIIYEDVKKLFPDGAVEKYVVPLAMSGGLPKRINPAIRLVHRTRGIEVTCSDFRTHTENFVAAVIRLKIACDELDEVAGQ